MNRRLLAPSTLDTLPLNIAVLDTDGTILFTNRAWREFAAAEGGVDDHRELGTNYLAAAEGANDAYARQALEGVRGVLDGDRELFTLEYHCHSPEQRRWFLMRVAPFELDGQRYAVVAHANITDRKLAEQAAAERADQLAHLLERVNGLVRDVTGAVVEARTRTAVERELCGAFAATAPYLFAWVARPDLRAETLVPRASAGVGPALDEGLSVSSDAPAARAYRTGELQICVEERAADGAGLEGPDDNVDLDAWDAEDSSESVDDVDVVTDQPDQEDGVLNGEWGPDAAVAVAAVPLSYRATSYGVLVVYADRPDVFDDRERAVLSALGEVAATAIHAVTTGRVLETGSVVELELTVEDDASPVAGAAGSDASLTYEDAFVTETGAVRLYLTVTGGDPEAVRQRAADRPDVTGVRLLTEYEGGALLELVADEPLVATAADFDGVTTALAADNGAVTATLQFPDETAARAAFEHLQERYEGVALTGYGDRERSVDTAAGFRADLEASLTDRQLEALRLAYYSGYFDRPRDVSGEEVADAMGITRTTFHQHLRTAQRKLVVALLEPDLL